MDAYEAARLVNENVTYKPGWFIRAVVLDYQSLLLGYRAIVHDSDKADAPEYPNPILASGEKLVNTSNLEDSSDLYAEVLKFLLEGEIHESREFFKVGKDYHPPFHPHTEDGKKQWNEQSHRFTDYQTW